MTDTINLADIKRVLAEWNISGTYDVGLVLGTGLGGLADLVEEEVRVPYAAIPHFPKSHISGHAGQLIAGRIGNTRILVMQGRAHYYEHGDVKVMRGPIETLAALGMSELILTNAAGSLREDLSPGSLALIADHINLTGLNPMIGMTDDSRFVPMVDAYDPMMRAMFHTCAKQIGVPLKNAIYQWFPGPSFETPAEIRAAKILGADLVGMSTVPEVIIARRIGVKVAALSMVTNFGSGLFGGAPHHDETKRVANIAAQDMAKLIRAYLASRPSPAS
jgi:purine-nucleoside phosphorylase